MRTDCSVAAPRSSLLVGEHARLELELGHVQELVVGAFDGTIEQAPVNPTRLNVRQVVKDADERKEGLIGAPSGLLVVEAIEVPKYCTAEIPEPAQEQLALVCLARRKVDLFVGRHAETVREAGVPDRRLCASSVVRWRSIAVATGSF